MTRKRDWILCQARAPLWSYYPSRGLALRRKRVAFGLAGETAGFRTPHIRFRTAPTKCVDTSLREGRPIFFQRTLSCVSRGFFRQQKSLYRKKRDKPMLVSFSGIGIRTPTNRVRVCRATVTQYRYNVWYFITRFTFCQYFCRKILENFCPDFITLFILQKLLLTNHQCDNIMIP